MKKIFLLFVMKFFLLTAFAQKQSFDIVSYTPPKGWVKSAKQETVTYTKEDNTKNTFCIITLYKSSDATSGDSKVNFDANWETIVKNTLGAVEPQMQPVSTKMNGNCKQEPPLLKKKTLRVWCC